MAKKKAEISTDPNDLVRRAELRHRDWSSQSFKNARVEPIINDETYKYHICPVVDGQVKAHGGVPRDFHKFPREMFDPPSEMVLIAESEVADRVKEQEDKKARVSDLMRRGGPGGQLYPSLDQDGVGYCHTADTEVLTEKGWVPWPEYNYSDLLATVSPASGMMEFQAPFERHVYPYDGETIYSTNGRLDFGVTPDHRMYVRKWDESRRTLSDRYTFQRAGDIGWYAGFMHAPRGFLGTELRRVAVPGDREYDGDDFLALLALVTSDGYAGGSEGSRPGKGTRNLVSFAAFREDRREATAALAARLGFTEAPSRPGVWNRWNAGALAEWLRANAYTSPALGAENKRVPDVVKVASGRQIRHFFDFFGDRSYRPGVTQFYSTSKRLTDDLQELHLRIGKRGTIGRAAPRSHRILGNPEVSHCKALYTLSVGQEDRLCIDRKKHIERDRYKGLVYCAAVPNGTLITRRNGSVLISGNCWAHSSTGAMMAVRAMNNNPYVPLSAFCVAATIKHGADQGGWCGESAQFARTKGICSQAIWPQGDRDYKKYDKPETWANADLHKSTEEWVDLTRDLYDVALTDAMIWTIALTASGAMAWDFNWWSHSVMGCDVCIVDGAICKRIRNSWGDSYGDKGFAVLQGSKAKVDSAICIRVAGAAGT